MFVYFVCFYVWYMSLASHIPSQISQWCPACVSHQWCLASLADLADVMDVAQCGWCHQIIYLINIANLDLMLPIILLCYIHSKIIFILFMLLWLLYVFWPVTSPHGDHNVHHVLPVKHWIYWMENRLKIVDKWTMWTYGHSLIIFYVSNVCMCAQFDPFAFPRLISMRSMHTFVCNPSLLAPCYLEWRWWRCLWMHHMEYLHHWTQSISHQVFHEPFKHFKHIMWETL